MNQAADLVIITLGVGVVALVTFAAVVAWRMVRKLRRWRSRLELVLPTTITRPGPDLVASTWSHAYRTSLAAGALLKTGTPRQAMWLRRDLWSHVSAAEVAVKAATATGTPMGQLPQLMGHLRDRARRHDQVLILASKGVAVVGPSECREETGRIIDQADAVSAAVVDAVRADATIDDRQLSSQLDRETRSVSHGAARVHALRDAASG